MRMWPEREGELLGGLDIRRRWDLVTLIMAGAFGGRSSDHSSVPDCIHSKVVCTRVSRNLVVD